MCYETIRPRKVDAIQRCVAYNNTILKKKMRLFPSIINNNKQKSPENCFFFFYS